MARRQDKLLEESEAIRPQKKKILLCVKFTLCDFSGASMLRYAVPSISWLVYRKPINEYMDVLCALLELETSSADV